MLFSYYYCRSWYRHQQTHASKCSHTIFSAYASFRTLRPRQNGLHFPDDIFKYIFWNENHWISIKISLKLVPKGQINNIPSLFEIMAWRRPGDKPLSEAMMVSLPTHICVTRPQWFKYIEIIYFLRLFYIIVRRILPVGGGLRRRKTSIVSNFLFKRTQVLFPIWFPRYS